MKYCPECGIRAAIFEKGIVGNDAFLQVTKISASASMIYDYVDKGVYMCSCGARFYIALKETVA